MNLSKMLLHFATEWLQVLLLCSLMSAHLPVVFSDEKRDLAREVFTVLQRRCLECHCDSRHDGGFRVDSRKAILTGGDSGVAVKVAAPESSELLRRIRLPKGHDEVMPKRGDVLHPSDIDLVRDWVAAGLPWYEQAVTAKHWAYVAPTRSDIIEMDASVTSNPIDYWVGKGLASKSLASSPSAEAQVLIRRIYFDTIGLPPTVDDVDAFAKEAAADLSFAVEKWVDRLIQSPQYGEKWARPWLDAARYADSHGFQRDDLHELWAYRDWVIKALNQDMPFDQFTIEQLAGDLLPNATVSQRVATGFNRCAPCNVEAGTDPIENRFNQVVDRVNTLGYVWLGSTLECAQCHDHKYDPFTQKDYYGLFAFLNHTEIEADRTNSNVPGSIRFIGPYMNLEDADTALNMRQLDDEIAVAKERLDRVIQSMSKATTISSLQSSRIVLEPIQTLSSGGSSFATQKDGSVLVGDDPPDVDTYTINVEWSVESAAGLLLETLTDPSLPGSGPGRGDADRPNFVLNHFEAIPLNRDDAPIGPPIRLVDATADHSQKSFDVSNAIDDSPKSAWAIGTQFKRPHWAAFRIADASQLANAKKVQFRLVQNFGGARTIGRFRLSALVGDYESSLPRDIQEPANLTKLRKQVTDLEAKRNKLAMPKTLVMQELNAPRATTMFARGDVRSPTEKVEPATPSILHPMVSEGLRNRLTLARWLVSPENPLTPRVIVNRMWAEVFGIGLVATPEDFGLKGELPSHPELLDALAISFVDGGWSQKKLLRQILISKTYQQSSRLSPEAREQDPQNLFLARGPRFRFTAELIRDNALAIAGKLSLKQFGSPIRPPQPAGLWRKVGGQQYEYEVSPGDEQFRRGVYVVLKRMSPYPSFINFDATARLACRVNRGRSNTPLQALNLLNDPVYVDAARGLATRIQNETANLALMSQLAHGFRIAVARSPDARELSMLCRLYADELEAMKSESSDTEARSRAWFSVATALLNLDETITKE